MFTQNICTSCFKRLVSRSSFDVSKFAITQSNLSIRLQLNRFLRTSHSLVQKNNRYSDKPDTQLPVRYLYVHTSIGRWVDIPDGLVFDVGYGDSMPDKPWTRATPTVLGLHSTPGSHEDLGPLLQPFVKLGCRVIAPNFPGFDYTEGIISPYNDVFTHSTDEKAEFVRDFLHNMGVESVDLVIGHGAACNPLLRLATTKETAHLFKSAVLISPWPHRPFRGINPYSLHQRITALWDRPALRFMCRLLARRAAKSLGLQGHSINSVIRTSQTVTNMGFDEIAGILIAADMLMLPCAVFYSGDDKFIEEDVYKEFLHLMGISADREMLVGEDGKICVPASVEGFPKTLRFESGGQDLHTRYPGLINAVSWSLLQHVRPDAR
ncbi:uncharacterized protein LOC124141047 [Haliotis rufescens]|uniref:uncharacterized protein LOC124141047 n=1 Tax=Haliotis rufescens TaxID=6454 RepID=UPI00201F967C|nr:uncharacterized protein LOC124141047 [Haliotis rufescens]